MPFDEKARREAARALLKEKEQAAKIALAGRRGPGHQELEVARVLVGPVGPQGEEGPQGPAGPQGPQGDRGERGPQGEQGERGAEGPQGPQGFRGEPGPKGEKGDPGEVDFDLIARQLRDATPNKVKGLFSQIGVVGPQGPKGDPGAPGSGGSTYVHTQSTPAATWIMAHSLGRRVHVTLFDDSFNEIETDIVQGDLNTATATFAVPVTGSAVLG